MTFEIKKAVKSQSRLRLALVGPSGSGKTYTALELAQAFELPVGVVDSEHGSASKYADLYGFDHLVLESFAPSDYIAAIDAMDKHLDGKGVIIVDSLSHEWAGKGGALEMVDKATKRSKSQNSYFAWGEVTPEHNRWIDSLLACKCHLIGTIRAKTEYVIENVNGKQVPRKIGMGPVQRDGLEYEFDIVGEMDLDNTLIINKSRMSGINGETFKKPTRELGRRIIGWLLDGTPDVPLTPLSTLLGDLQGLRKQAKDRKIPIPPMTAKEAKEMTREALLVAIMDTQSWLDEADAAEAELAASAAEQQEAEEARAESLTAADIQW